MQNVQTNLPGLALWTLGAALMLCSPLDAGVMAGSTLDRDIENLKKSLLILNRDMTLLEEDLLFPPRNRVTVYLSLNPGTEFRLSKVLVEIDDEPVASNHYSELDIHALKRGGIQRVYIGTLPTGRHEIRATIQGETPQGSVTISGLPLKLSQRHQPIVVQLNISGSEHKGRRAIGVENWLL